MASKPKVSIDAAAAMLPALRKRRRGPPSNGFKKGNTHGFKKGESGNPGGKPRVFQKFSAKVAEEMMQPASPDIKKALKLKRGATVYDAMVKALLLQAAQGDTYAFTTARETVEGKLIQRNMNISASLQALQDDPEFVKWMEDNHAEYLSFKNEASSNDGRQTIEATPRALPAGESAEG